MYLFFEPERYYKTDQAINLLIWFIQRLNKIKLENF